MTEDAFGMPSGSHEGAAGSGALEWEVASETVRDLFQTLGKALRAYQLYDENNPVYQRFVNALRDAFSALWNEVDDLRLRITEDAILGEGDEVVYQGESRADSLAFLFYKDGVRRITFRPGLETSELERFLGVLQRARNARPEGDDLLTILWEADLQYFSYEYVDLLAQGVDIPDVGDFERYDLGQVLTGELPGFEVGEGGVGEEADEGEAGGAARAAAAPAPAGTMSQDDFNPTLYALDGAEQQAIARELERELARPLRAEVLHALLDRLEDGTPARQLEVLEIFGSLLPSFLSRGALGPAVELLEELRAIVDSGSTLAPEARDAAVHLVREVSRAETIRELIRSVVDGTIQPDPRRLGALLGHLEAGALVPLLQATQELEDRQLWSVMIDAIRVIGEKNPRDVLALLASDDPAITAAACGLSGSMKLAGAAPYLARLAGHPVPSVRLAAIDATRQLGSAGHPQALVAALEDPERDVRIAAAKALGEARYRQAIGRLRDAIEGREIREADLTEMRAFFEAFGALADDAEVPLLGRLLSRKRFLRGHEPSELRACAALALGRIGSPAAHEALREATNDPDAVVRSAAARALRGAPGEPR